MEKIEFLISDEEMALWKEYCQKQGKTGAEILQNFILHSINAHKPCFIDDPEFDKTITELPHFILKETAYSKYGLRDGESVVDAIKRHEKEQEFS